MSPSEIRKLRMAHGLSREAAARLSGVRSRTLLNWETGRTRPMEAKLFHFRSVLESPMNTDAMSMLRVLHHLHHIVEGTARHIAKSTRLPRPLTESLLLRLCQAGLISQFSPGWFAISPLKETHEYR